MPLVDATAAAEILNVSVPTVYTLASSGAIARHAPKHARGQAYDLDELEQRSLRRLRRDHTGGHPYWVTVAEAADWLSVSDSRVRQMLDAEQLPSVTAPSGRRYVRRHQLEVIGNVRDQRRAGR